eukprot:NODE_152_length_15391_cov_0.883272.p16 type:complete len:164 gc:universal NODE_152_length_15391_cov_0.883272:13854-13363(-)
MSMIYILIQSTFGATGTPSIGMTCGIDTYCPTGTVCSSWGWCGSGPSYESGCKPGFDIDGTCKGDSDPPSPPPVQPNDCNGDSFGPGCLHVGNFGEIPDPGPCGLDPSLPACAPGGNPGEVPDPVPCGLDPSRPDCPPGGNPGELETSKNGHCGPFRKKKFTV